MAIKPAELLTLPNAVSAAGFALVVHGAMNMDTTFGLAEVAAGRSLDVLDGYLARRLNQSSPLGAALDATLDKLAMGAIIVSAGYHDMAPVAALAGIAVQNAGNIVATAVAKHNYPDRELHPSRAGKYAMALQNIALGAYGVSFLLEQGTTSDSFGMLGHVAAITGIGLGVKATIDYFRRARRQPTTRPAR